MEQLKSSVEEVYKERSSLIILGLTGRTGSGCSTVANILKKPSIKELDLHDQKPYDYKNIEEIKDNIIAKYMKEENRWKPFITIEVSSIILSFVFEKGYDCLVGYLEKIKSGNKSLSFKIGDFDDVIEKLKGIDYIYKEIQNYPLNDVEQIFSDPKRTEKYYNFYTQQIITYKNRFKSILSNYSGNEIEKQRSKEKKIKKYHLYTYLLQQFGNNIRSSGNPFEDTFNQCDYNFLTKRIDHIIQIIIKHNLENETRICIDAIRNPFEALYLRDRYRSFYLLSINTEEEYRTKRLNLNKEELANLDSIEKPIKFYKAQEIFYHQDIQKCLETADIHIYNPDVDNNKYYNLTEQLLKYIALILQPGLVTPTSIERCMQLAYNAKFNSGCLSRQVGAIVTGEDFSIKSVGWNNVPDGQVACNLRDIVSFCSNKDAEIYSEYECCDKEYGLVLDKIGSKVKQLDLAGKPCSYCFKDIYNGIENNKNQVYTRSLHAEENAFLQISKYGGQGIKNGKLFTTASPCELCAKKSYQLGIKDIYYIDPYPGISKSHILQFGKENNPQMHLFRGAIGNAFISLYAPRMPYKDELELCTGISFKEEASHSVLNCDKEIKWNDLHNKSVTLELMFESREKIICTRDIEFEVKCEDIENIERAMIWTGSSYDGSELISSCDGYTIKDIHKGGSQYNYIIDFGKKVLKGDTVKYTLETKLKDEKQVMEPYFSHRVNNPIDDFIIRIKCLPGLVKKVCIIAYADTFMECEFERHTLKKHLLNGYEIYEFKKKNPNLFYSYSIEWEFLKK